jgi:hypothetical protein
MNTIDDILFSPVSKSKEWYMKGEKVPDHILKFEDQRVVCRFGVDAELIKDERDIQWVYPLEHLVENECVVEIIYPEKRFFNNKNSVIISIDPHHSKRDPNHKPQPNTDAVRETWM